jgi:hypothetical protein
MLKLMGGMRRRTGKLKGSINYQEATLSQQRGPPLSPTVTHSQTSAKVDGQFGTDIPHNYTVGAHGRPLCKECQPHLNLHALKKDDDNARQALRDVAGKHVALPAAVVRFVVAGKAKNMKAAGNDNAHAGDHAQPQ